MTFLLKAGLLGAGEHSPLPLAFVIRLKASKPSAVKVSLETRVVGDTGKGRGAEGGFARSSSPNIDVGISGIWECMVTSSRGNTSQQMEIVVLETSAPYCPTDRVTNNKGDFRWPKTLAGILAFLPCAPSTFGSAPHPSGGAHSPSSQREKKAWRRCDRAGRWAEEDYNQCPYASELTRVLHELTQITINTTNAQPLGRQLVAFTSRAAHFTDVMDVIFVTHLVERLTRLVDKRRDLGDYISDIASNMMLVEEHILWMAQNEARACTRIVQCVERIADLALTGDNQVISKVSANIALEAFLIRPSNFLGLSCTALQLPPASAPSPLPGSHSHDDKGAGRERDTAGESMLNFKCHTVNSSGPPASQISKLLLLWSGRDEGSGTLFESTLRACGEDIAYY
ncbi:unnamed protein product [Pleuronectes platessa]|uniref:G-protein coupled receptors family 2 profile 1 domain-containing protein n=1 Tax=Pleuronectes platessa TaxID=8262 RepID=A0A9N7Y142_PLEPL|nr:unnamed protein product [Pleuronectes platessa]